MSILPNLRKFDYHLMIFTNWLLLFSKQKKIKFINKLLIFLNIKKIMVIHRVRKTCTQTLKFGHTSSGIQNNNLQKTITLAWRGDWNSQIWISSYHSLFLRTSLLLHIFSLLLVVQTLYIKCTTLFNDYTLYLVHYTLRTWLR
jgi:hypothetical protein